MNLNKLGKAASIAAITVGVAFAAASSNIASAQVVESGASSIVNCDSVVGTYLAKSTSPSDPTSVTSELISFNKEGAFTATDSNAGGDPDATSFQNQPFGPILGSWKCTGNREIVARGFNFNYQTRKGVPASISITTYKLRFEPKTQTITGTTSFDAYDLNSTPQNPIRLPNIGGPFLSNYVGNRITAQ